MKRIQEAGFALLQLMISLAILSVICVLTWAAVQQISRTKHRREDNIDRYQTGRNALSRMVRDLSMAYLSTNQLPGRNSAPRTFFEGLRKSPTDELRFTYFGHLRFYEDTAEGNTAAVSYMVRPDIQDTRRLNLIRRENKRIQYVDPGALDSIAGDDEILGDGITRLEFWYYDAVGKRWVDTWRTTQGDSFPNRLPSRILIKLALSTDQGKDLTFFSEVRPAMFQSLDNSPK